MNKNLTIIVAGPTNSGKSTMMLQLQKLLMENGFNVELSFEGNPDYTGENTYHLHKKVEKDFDKVIEKIKTETKITLMEKQMNSSGIPT